MTIKIKHNPREPSKIKHTLLSMVQQRIYGIALGYEDLNDHATLRHDPAIQTAVDRLDALASSPTLCRLENRANRQMIFEANQLMVEKFIESFAKPPREIILDFDATEDEVHGHQENRHYHGYYKSYCFLPLHVFCGDQLLVSYLTRIFHEKSGENLKYPIRFSMLKKNQDDSHHDKV